MIYMLKNNGWRSVTRLAALILALMTVFVLPGLAEQAEYGESEVPAHDHEWGETEFEPDEDMVYAYVYCTFEGCEEFLQASAELQKTTKGPTCTEPGCIIYSAHFEEPFGDYREEENTDEQPLEHDICTTYTLSSDYTSMTAALACQREGCGYVEQQETASTTSQVISEPTCTESGETEYTAAFTSEAFGTHIISVTTPAKGHKPEKTAAAAATCDTAGNNEYYTCSVCGKYFSDENGTTEIKKDSWVIPAAHKLTKTDAVAATCTTDGNDAYWTCSVCKKYFSDENGTNEITADSWVIPAAHSLTKTDAVAATCTTAGNSAYWTCSVCGEHFSDENGTNKIAADSWVIPAAHKLTKTDAVAATCTTAGNSAYWTCSVCGKYFSDEAGTTEIEKDSWIIPALGHKPEKTAAAAATCDTAGNNEYYTCSACGKFFSDEACTTPIEKDSWVIPALGHKPVKTAAVAPTASTPGNKEYYTCSVCGKYFSDEACTTPIAKDSWILPPTQHTIVKVEAVPATCLTPGSSEYYTCTTCGKFFSDEAAKDEQEIEKDSWITAPLGHSLEGHGAVAPTCTRTGHAPFWRCTRCQEVFADVDGQIPTTIENQTIRTQGHKLEVVERKDSTCTEQGYDKHYICKECGNIFKDGAAKTPLTQEQVLLPLASHTGGTAICGYQAICTVCNQPYGPSGLHPTNKVEYFYTMYTYGNPEKNTIIKESYCNECNTYFASCEVILDSYQLFNLMIDPTHLRVVSMSDDNAADAPESNGTTSDVINFAVINNSNQGASFISKITIPESSAGQVSSGAVSADAVTGQSFTSDLNPTSIKIADDFSDQKSSGITYADKETDNSLSGHWVRETYNIRGVAADTKSSSDDLSDTINQRRSYSSNQRLLPNILADLVPNSLSRTSSLWDQEEIDKVDDDNSVVELVIRMVNAK